MAVERVEEALQRINGDSCHDGFLGGDSAPCRTLSRLTSCVSAAKARRLVHRGLPCPSPAPRLRRLQTRVMPLAFRRSAYPHSLDALQLACLGFVGMIQVPPKLQVHPEIRRRAEELAEPQRRSRRDAAAPVYQLVAPLIRHT